MSLANNISKIRAKYNISQEQFAEKLGVSRQAVQKWENGTSVPELSHIINIAKKFGFSIDALILDSDSRIMEELKNDRLIQPCFEKMHLYCSYPKQLDVEYSQCIGEGKDVTNYTALFDEVQKLPDGSHKKKIAEGIYELCMAIPVSENFGFDEPSDLNKIFEKSKGLSKSLSKPSKKDFENKIRGAWYGRIAGCLLGKPIECIRTNELIPFLKETNNYPMHRYIVSTDAPEEVTSKYNFHFSYTSFYADKITTAPCDDDTNYTVLAQKVIEDYGRDFTPDDVATTWIECQPQTAYCTAERVAYNNFTNGYLPPVSAVYKNPYREFIGAQIRADYFGYINPADPKTAAEMAWRDASISHVKNGIYGEMFVAAMLAGAAATANFEEIVEIGLSQIPKTSRLFDSITRLLSWYKDGVKCEEVFEKIHTEWDEYTNYGWCHTIPNAMIVVASLLYGEDYGKAICLAVQTGFDTDCNGATVGSIYGMAKGFGSIQEKWLAPFNGKLDTSILGKNLVKIDDVIEKTLTHAGY